MRSGSIWMRGTPGTRAPADDDEKDRVGDLEAARDGDERGDGDEQGQDKLGALHGMSARSDSWGCRYNDGDGLESGEMSGVIASLVEDLMDEGDGNRPLPDGRRHSLDVAPPHVADGEHAGQTRFE
jgi:hypothetical protein